MFGSKKFYFPTRWRNHNLLYILMGVELPLVVIILTLTGIANHDLYRTKLWQDGADNGFNSAPNEALYAAANHRPFTTPMVWSSLITRYNLVLGILAVFMWITKIPLHILHMLYPPVCAFVHAGLVAVWIYSVRYQAGPDMSDPDHPQPGAPWYITKKCSVAYVKSNVHYCQQAKALFAFSIIIILFYFGITCLSLRNCIITEEERLEIEERREDERAMKEFEDFVLKSPGIPMTTMQPLGMPPKSPMHHVTTAPSDGGSSSDLPLRQHFSTPNPRRSMQQDSTETLSGHQPQPQPYFPPPPKKAAKN
ncbi:hypothetical protein ASPACDRAFT_80012 [Aspergillus aculeatus ATCC 16872]|uniref:Uncharacterized protein n=1 Tax=Aspergillus aculeatus (strain ATCC 16872 / CBS 172.66 / WB 5094) TaxID=690307 RepID=A0A1L9WNZ6_ASPA1|nr:uncharacterized protein ASPACDRAFT_80012 [Aspergillus aculeatus ATCC 16872]OJJ97884.1 hypothetical protein ASPACDRAFT_80012 [Aspergillus aculeatus ATCC 16872]